MRQSMIYDALLLDFIAKPPIQFTHTFSVIYDNERSRYQLYGTHRYLFWLR